MNADVLFGKEGLNNLVHDYLIAAMQVGNFMNYLEQDLLIVTPGDRSDIILASLTSHLSSTYPNIAGILLTGGIAYSQYVTSEIEKRVSFLAPVVVYPGEDEMRSLALGGLRVLRGQETAKIFHKSESANG